MSKDQATCPVCHGTTIVTMQARMKHGATKSLAHWCGDCGSITRPDGEWVVPKMFVTDHMFVLAGMCVSWALVKAGMGDLLRVVDERPGDDSVAQLIARNFRSDSAAAFVFTPEKYGEMCAEVATRIRTLLGTDQRVSSRGGDA